MAPTTTHAFGHRVSRFAKYAFIAVALTGTAYYAYMQGFHDAHLDDDTDGENTNHLLSKNEEEEDDDDDEEEREEDEDEDE